MSAPAILVIAEFADGKPAAATLELLGLARGIADRAPVTALAFGAGDAGASALIAAGADDVVTTDAALANYDSEAWTACAAHVAREIRSRVVLATHTSRGADLVARLAFRLDGAVATGCSQITISNDALQAVRPCYGGNARETVTLACWPAVISMRSGVANALASDATRTGNVRNLDIALPGTRVIERHREAADAVRLEDARVVIAGGRGLDGPEGFVVLRDLAAAMGGAVGASRVPCDLGWCPHSMQIGLTGKTVTPELYIAVGISGAGHHLAGCGNAKTIVAINTDADAPIFRHARFGVVGDYRKLVPALAEAVATAKTEAAT